MTNQQIDLNGFTPIVQLEFEHLDNNYKSAHLVGTSIVYAILMALATLLLLTDSLWIFIACECLILAVAIINLSLLPKAFLLKGYALRDHDISYRSGMIFPKVTTIPYSKVQQVSVNQNPISRYFKLYTVEIVNGAQSLTSLRIPGLTKEKATHIKELITDKIRDCHD